MTAALRELPERTRDVFPAESTPQDRQPWSSLQLAQATPGPRPGAVSVGGTPQSSTPVIQEAIVTAQQRAERLQDVPVPVTVVNTSSPVASSHSYRA